MKFFLGINTGFALNRYSNFNDLFKDIKEKIKLKKIQFTADLLNLNLSSKQITRQTNDIKKSLKLYKIDIISCFTGAYTRVNHLSNPNKEIRSYWIRWFQKYINFCSDIECDNIGSHLGILSYAQLKNFNFNFKRTLETWHELGEYAKKKGIKYFLWEPMSIDREFGETIAKCRVVQKKLNYNSPIPFKICLDVDHGDICSKNKDDRNPYKWIEQFADETPLIHLKQSYHDKGGHWPFTKYHNRKGKIFPKLIIEKFKIKKNNNLNLILEINFKEREPHDKNLFKELKETVNFWKKEYPDIII